MNTERNKNGVLAFTTHIEHEKPDAEKNQEDLDLAADLEIDTSAVAETYQATWMPSTLGVQRALN